MQGFYLSLATTFGSGLGFCFAFSGFFAVVPATALGAAGCEERWYAVLTIEVGETVRSAALLDAILTPLTGALAAAFTWIGAAGSIVVSTKPRLLAVLVISAGASATSRASVRRRFSDSSSSSCFLSVEFFIPRSIDTKC